MDTMSSAEFRKRYAKLTNPTVITVVGHPIGMWTPIAVDHLAPAKGMSTVVAVSPEGHRFAVPTVGFGQSRPAPKPKKK